MKAFIRASAIGALLVAACAPVLASAQQLSGVTFDLTTTAHGGNDSTVTRGKGWVSGSQLRLDLSGASLIGPAAGMPDGNHTFLFRRDSLQRNVMTLVDHNDSSYMEPGKMMAQMTEMVASLPAEMRPRISMETRNVRVDTLGAGDVISGFATRRYRISMQIVVKVEVLDQKQENSMTIESDGMYSEELSEFGILSQWTRSYESMLGPMMAGDTTALAEFRRMEAAFPKGFPLRSEDRVTASEGLPGVRTVTLINNIVRTTFPQSVFEVPPGYKETTIPTMPGMN